MIHVPLTRYSTAPPRQQEEQGSTLAELAVGMLVAAVVLAGAYAAYLFAAQSIGTWRERQVAASAHYALERRMAEDVRQSAVLAPLPEGFALLGARGDTLALYRVQQGSLTRNSRPLGAGMTAKALHATAAGGELVYVEVALEEGEGRAEGGMRRISARLRSASLAAWHTGARETIPLP